MPKRVEPLNAKQIEKWHPDPRSHSRTRGRLGAGAPRSPHAERDDDVVAVCPGEWRTSPPEPWGRTRLAEARRKAENARRQIADGVDPAAAKTAARERRKAAAEGHGTLGSVIAAYYEVGPGKDLRSGKAARAVIEVVFAGHLSRPSLDVRPGQCRSRPSLGARNQRRRAPWRFSPAGGLGPQTRTYGERLRRSRNAGVGAGWRGDRPARLVGGGGWRAAPRPYLARA